MRMLCPMPHVPPALGINTLLSQRFTDTHHHNLRSSQLSLLELSAFGLLECHT